MATRITQEQLNKFISPDAAMAPYERAEKQRQQRVAGEQAMQQQIVGDDSRLRQLITGKNMDEASGQRNIDANVRRMREEMRRSGVDPSKSSQTFNETGASFNPETDAMGKAVKKALLASNITGYNVADPDNVVPSPKDAEEVKKATGSFKALKSTADEVREKFKTASRWDRFGSVKIPFTSLHLGTDKGMSLDSGLTDMVIQLKELANLGAITGPDLLLMESAMGNVTGIGSLVGGSERALRQLTDVINRARAKVRTNATSRGYAPQEGYLDSSTAQPAPPPEPELPPGALTREQWRAERAKQ